MCNRWTRSGPSARESSRAATVESTPPETSRKTERSPTRAQRRSTSSSTKRAIVHDGEQPQIQKTKLAIISLP